MELVNGIKVIKMNLSFKLGTGETDQMCYESESEKAGKVLNRFGALRLLSVMDKQCKCLRIKENIEKSDGITYPNNFSAMNRNKTTVNRNKMSQNQFEGHNFERRNARQNHYRRIPEYRQQYQQADSRYFSRTYESSNPQTDERRQKGCFNCGEYNHRQTNCRYDHRIRCNYCFKYGHKSRMCTGQNS